MPICKNCHHEITKFDADVCPYCGTIHPIDDNYKTRDMTSFVDPITGDYKLYKSKSRKIAGVFSLFLGIFSADLFYLGFAKKAIFRLLIDLILIGGVGSLFFFLVPGLKGNWLSYLLVFGVLFVVYLIYSFHYFLKDSLVDSHGEFLR